MKFRIVRRKSQYYNKYIFGIQRRFLFMWFYPENRLLDRNFDSIEESEAAISHFIENKNLVVVKELEG